MSITNFQDMGNRARRRLALATGRTLTIAECQYQIVTGTTALSVTLPAGSGTQIPVDGGNVLVQNCSGVNSSVVKVIAAAGFGKGGSNYIAVPLAIGQFGEFRYSQKYGYWFYNSVAAATSS